jgi:lipid II:glycine glycyltransferase (peptidoglycan interpeptide bridge formation enzyme)
LFFGQWAEYFIPVSDEEFRSDQVLSAIILRAMTDAAVAGVRYWNWGGTWSSQEGVYRFKSRWGARDYSYQYHGKVFDHELLGMSPETIRRQFPNFYVRRFS